MITKATKKGKITMVVSAIAACVILAVAVLASGVLSDKTQGQDRDKAQEIMGLSESQTNILLIGVDGRGQMGADALMVLSLDRSNNKLTALSIPRDTLIMTDQREVKIAHLMTDGDEQRIMDAVIEQLDIPVHYYARINFEGFRNIIDILGGVTFDVPVDMFYDDEAQNLHIALAKGVQVLDGEKAEYLLRYRAGYPEGDLARVRMQQSFIEELVKQKWDAKYFTEISKLYNEFSKNLATNYPFVKIAEDIQALSTVNIQGIETMMLPGAMELRQGVSYFVVDDAELKSLTEQKFMLK